MNRSSYPIYLFAAVITIMNLTAPARGAEGVSREAALVELDGPTLFERMKSLVGEWRGRWMPGDTDTTVTYRLTGNGSVLAEDYLVGETTMSTLYHLDGDELMLTHYCSAGNQPRMRASALSSDPLQVVFDQFDVTNLQAGKGYSDRLTMTFTGEDRIAIVYRGSRTGRSSGVELERVR